MKNILFSLVSVTRYVKTVFALLALAIIMFFQSSCKKEDGTPGKSEIIYVGTNNYHENQNAIVAYQYAANGTLQQIPGSPFLTKGTGVSNLGQILGPNDKETPVIIYKNEFLLAVNGGSNTIAVFRIVGNGRLLHVPGSPFSCGGVNPVSLATSGNYLYVVNKSQDPMRPTNILPNYTTFTIEPNGSLSPVAGSKFETGPGVSPTQVLISNDRRFIFGTDFLGFMAGEPQGTLRSFKRNDNGTIAAVSGTPYFLPGKVSDGALGLWQHPYASVLYVGFPLQAKIGVYNINAADGSLTFSSSVAGAPANCWIRVTRDGKYMYTLSAADNSVSVYNTSSPMSPVLLQQFTMKNSGPIISGTTFTSSAGFHLAFSKNERLLYVVGQHTNPDFNAGNFNFLHTLVIGADGKLTEPGEPIQLPVAADIRPEGVAVYND